MAFKEGKCGSAIISFEGTNCIITEALKNGLLVANIESAGIAPLTLKWCSC